MITPNGIGGIMVTKDGFIRIMKREEFLSDERSRPHHAIVRVPMHPSMHVYSNEAQLPESYRSYRNTGRLVYVWEEIDN